MSNFFRSMGTKEEWRKSFIESLICFLIIGFLGIFFGYLSHLSDLTNARMIQNCSDNGGQAVTNWRGALVYCIRK